MKYLLLVLLFLNSPQLLAYSYLSDQKNGDGYFYIGAGSFSVAPNFGTGGATGFGVQFFRAGSFGFGLDVLNGVFKPNASLDGYSRMYGATSKYYFTESLNVGLCIGGAAQIQSNSILSQAATYGWYGASVGYDFHGRNELLGFAVDLQALNVMNSPVQTWLGGRLSIKLWFD